MAHQQCSTCWWTISTVSCGMVLSTGIPQRDCSSLYVRLWWQEASPVMQREIRTAALCLSVHQQYPAKLQVGYGLGCREPPKLIVIWSKDLSSDGYEPVQHITFASPPRKTTVEQHLLLEMIGSLLPSHGWLANSVFPTLKLIAESQECSCASDIPK